MQIPLSGYGGTSNIILEDQRKQGDGYVATMTDIAVGHVSKVCLCVRNTGSRAAFIKAIAFCDVQTRSIMEPTIISLAPSQFVLKERTQEVSENLTHKKVMSQVVWSATTKMTIVNTMFSCLCVCVFSGHYCANEVLPKRTEFMPVLLCIACFDLSVLWRWGVQAAI